MTILMQNMPEMLACVASIEHSTSRVMPYAVNAVGARFDGQEQASEVSSC